MKNKKIGWLVYKPERKRNKENSFDSNYNIGSLVIINELKKAGYGIEYVTPESVKKEELVLVSFSSILDLIAYYKAIAKYKHWGNRKFKIIGGGFGLQNIYSIRNYIDIAVFGRAENQIVEIIKGNYDFDNVMVLPKIKPTKMRQAAKLYPYNIKFKGGKLTWEEKLIGCPNKCKFCHYTWARKYIGDSNTYSQGYLGNNKSPEILWKNIHKINVKPGKIRTAIDGVSERLRFLYGKKISNDEIITGIETLGNFCGNTIVLINNIVNMPSETEQDYQELIEIMNKSNPKNRVIIVLQNNSFRPSTLTPMQWMPVKLLPSWNELSGKVLIERKNLRVIHSLTNDSSWSQLQTIIIERANEQSGKLIDTMCFSTKLNKWDVRTKVKILQDNFDLTPYLREYDINEQLPTWYLESYTPNEKIKKMAKILKQKILK